MAYRYVSDEVLELAPGDRRELCFSFDDVLEEGEEIIYCNTSFAEDPGALIFGADHWMTDGRRVYRCSHSATKVGYYEVGWAVWTMKNGAKYRELDRTWLIQVKEM